MSKTKIAWAEHSINPVRVRGGGHHCTKVSPGCQNCYAEKRNMNSFFGGNKMPYDNRKVEYYLDLSCFDKLPKTKPQIVFVQSMSDLFHDDVPYDILASVLAMISMYEQHNFLVLTKRIEIFQEEYKHLYDGDLDHYRDELIEQGYNSTINPIKLEYQDSSGRGQPPLIQRIGASRYIPTPIPNLWLGVTVEHPDYLWRVNELLQIPAAVRFVSLEPLLESMGTSMLKYIRNNYSCELCGYKGYDYEFETLMPESPLKCHMCKSTNIKRNRLDWVIVGTESGRKRRECKIEWVRNIVEQCKAANVPVFVKQLHINDKVSDNMAEWPEDLRVQEWPA